MTIDQALTADIDGFLGRLLEEGTIPNSKLHLLVLLQSESAGIYAEVTCL